MRSKLWNSIVLLLIVTSFLKLQSCSSFGASCADEVPVLSVIDDNTFEWFRVFEDSNSIPFEDRRFNQGPDTTVVRIDTFDVIPDFQFFESSGCLDHCPSICQSINAELVSVEISAFGPPEMNVISITTKSGFPFDNSYTLRIDSNGELIDSLDIFNVEDSNFGDRFTRAEQWERDRVTLNRFEELEFEGNTFMNCYEIKDSTPINPPGFYRFTFIYCQEQGPILYETYKIANNPNFPNPLITSNSLKQIN